jgi:hypothetical protein
MNLLHRKIPAAVKAAGLTALCSLLLFPKLDESRTINFPAVSAAGLSNAAHKTKPDGTKWYTVKDITYTDYDNPFVVDLTLSMNRPHSSMTKDDSGRYAVYEADFIHEKGMGSQGGGAARFFKKDHLIAVESGRGGWLASCEDMGSFTIEFRAMPQTGTGTLFSRIGTLSGKKSGIEINLKNGALRSSLYGIFERPDTTKKDIHLGGSSRLKTGEWAHIALSYDRLSGRLSHIINGEETENIYITDTGQPFNGVNPPSFSARGRNGENICHDTPDAVIGKGYTGLIDEFRISYLYYEDLEKMTDIARKRHTELQHAGRLPVNMDGVVTSEVHDFGTSGTMVTEFRWKQLLEPETFVWMEFRISDNRFYSGDNELKWYRVANPQRKIYLQKIDSGEFLRGRYCQWRARMVPSPDGRRAPLLSGIALDYIIDNPPFAPRLVEAVSVSGREVTLSWQKNLDADLLGYRIYYGTVPGRYDGIISTVDGKRVSNSMAKGSRVEVKITNDLIEENRAAHPGPPLTFPPLQNTVLYYFAVSAYDSYKPDTPHNHESELSKPVTIRPYAGSEIQ